MAGSVRVQLYQPHQYGFLSGLDVPHCRQLIHGRNAHTVLSITSRR